MRSRWPPPPFLKEGDVVGAGAAFHDAGGELVMIGEDVIFGDRACRERDLQLANVLERGVPRVDEDAGASQHFIVDLAHVGLERPHGVHMGSGS